MDIEYIAIGDEVLYGYTVNTNASFIARTLLDGGFQLSSQMVVGDDPASLKKALKAALYRKSFVIVSGGLGPTCDDHTRNIISDLFQAPLVLNEEVLKRLEANFSVRETFKDQATYPEGALLFENKIGTASGFLLQNEKLFPGSFLLALPGVPYEFKDMVSRYLVELLQKKVTKTERLFIKELHLFNLLKGEADVDPELRRLSEKYPSVQFGIYPAIGTLSVHLKAEALNDAEFLKIIKQPLNEFEESFKDHIYKSTSGKIEEAVHLKLIEKKLKIALAESCTGGALAARFVSFSGASEYLKASIVAYSNEMKEKLLQVPFKTLETYGAVSEETTIEMAKGVYEECDVDIAIAVSGILGPTGGSEKKPVGTVCATILFQGKPVLSWTKNFKGTREVIQERAIINIFSELYTQIR